MKNTSSYLLAAPALILLAAILSGCASSPPSKFYQLSGMGGQSAVAPNVPSQDSEVVSIGPLRIPDYLDRPQIVTRSGKNEIRLAEFDRWAGSIEDDIIGALVEDIACQLPAGRFFVVRWSPILDSLLAYSYRVEMIVSRFEGPLDGAVTLRAQWGVRGKDKNILLRRESVVVEQVSGSGYDAYVNAMCRALERLSKEIADGIVSKGTI